ncbi:MAG: dihydropyrimidinase [Synergistaceae bacterium]|nr:dihydropyrimidinase [Synergistaceae bacterium]
MYDLVIRGGTIVTPDDVLDVDLALQGEKIAALGCSLEGKNVIDARGKLVFPGGIDPHVHFALPVAGTFSADDFSTGSAAACAGGITTVIDFTVGAAGRTIAEDLQKRLEDASASVVDYSFHGEVVGWHPGKLDEIREAISLGIKSFKFFTAYGRSGRRTDTGPMFLSFRTLAEEDAVALVHAEDESLIGAFTAMLSPEEFKKMVTFARVRPDLCEASAVNTVAWLAAKTGVRCHIVHLSSALGLEEVLLGKKRGAHLSAETCPHYLLLTSEAYQGPEGHLFSAAPALRSVQNSDFLWQGLQEGAIDFAATDHCPFSRKQKKWKGTFADLPGGLAGVETLLPLLYSEGVMKGKISLCDLVRITSEEAAKLYGLYPRKGSLLPGSDGDLVLFDPEVEWTVKAADLHSKADFSPYEGMQISGKVWKTLSRGEIIYSEGALLGTSGRGKFLPR